MFMNECQIAIIVLLYISVVTKHVYVCMSFTEFGIGSAVKYTS